jgi:hypothetical protein
LLIVVAVAQLVEHLTVAQVVAGSNPVSHPNFFIFVEKIGSEAAKLPKSLS